MCGKRGCPLSLPPPTPRRRCVRKPTVVARCCHQLIWSLAHGSFDTTTARLCWISANVRWTLEIFSSLLLLPNGFFVIFFSLLHCETLSRTFSDVRLYLFFFFYFSWNRKKNNTSDDTAVEIATPRTDGFWLGYPIIVYGLVYDSAKRTGILSRGISRRRLFGYVENVRVACRFGKKTDIALQWIYNRISYNIIYIFLNIIVLRVSLEICLGQKCAL